MRVFVAGASGAIGRPLVTKLVAAVERGAPGVYNITDDEPAWLAKLVGGKQAGTFALQLRGASNEKAKRELGWQPAHPSWRTGFPASLR